MGLRSQAGQSWQLLRCVDLTLEPAHSDDLVSHDGSDPVIQTGMIPAPGTYQSVLYQATKLDVNTPHYIQVTNLPGQSCNPVYTHY